MKSRKTIKSVFILAVVLIVIFAAVKISHIAKWGMDKTTSQQWETAVAQYDNWKNEVDVALYGKYGFISVCDDKIDHNYPFNEICESISLVPAREDFFATVGKVLDFEDSFPQKYRDIITNISELYVTYYVMEVDWLQVLHRSDSYLSDVKVTKEAILEQIQNLEKALYNKYLNPKSVTTYDVEPYSPATLSYSFNSLLTFVTHTPTSAQLKSALNKAEAYTLELWKKNNDIISVDYMGTYTYNAEFDVFYFDYTANYYGSSDRVGTITVANRDGKYHATGASFH